MHVEFYIQILTLIRAGIVGNVVQAHKTSTDIDAQSPKDRPPGSKLVVHVSTGCARET